MVYIVLYMPMVYSMYWYISYCYIVFIGGQQVISNSMIKLIIK